MFEKILPYEPKRAHEVADNNEFLNKFKPGERFFLDLNPELWQEMGLEPSQVIKGNVPYDKCMLEVLGKSHSNVYFLCFDPKISQFSHKISISAVPLALLNSVRALRKSLGEQNGPAYRRVANENYRKDDIDAVRESLFNELMIIDDMVAAAQNMAKEVSGV